MNASKKSFNARLEPLAPRRLFSKSPHGGAFESDVDVSGTVIFDDLNTLAQPYTTSKSWAAGDFTSDGVVNFDDLISLAQNYNAAQSAAYLQDWYLLTMPAPTATLGGKGKLFVEMGSFNNAVITTSGRHTRVRLTHVSRHGEPKPTNVLDRTFKNVRAIAIEGTPFDDVITLGDDVRFTTVNAEGGNDSLTGGNGSSALFGGDGDDVIYAGAGNDSAYGGLGEDRLFGDGGDDLLDGGAGKDRLDGGGGRNKLIGGVGLDRLTFRKKDRIDHDARDRIKELA